MADRRGLLASALLILVGATACAGPSASTEVSTPPAAMSASSSEAPRSITIEIFPLEDNTAHGTMVIDIQGDAHMMTVTVLGLEPNSQHWLNMHGGTCAHPIIDPSEMVSLPDLQADATGQGTLSTRLYAYPYQVPTGGRILTVHNVARDSQEPQSHIACADLTN